MPSPHREGALGETRSVRRARLFGAAATVGMIGIVASTLFAYVRGGDDVWRGDLIEVVALGLWMVPYVLFATWVACLVRVASERGAEGLPSGLTAGLGMFFFPLTLAFPVRLLRRLDGLFGARTVRPINAMFGAHLAGVAFVLLYATEVVGWWRGAGDLADAASVVAALASILVVTRIDAALTGGSVADVFS